MCRTRVRRRGWKLSFLTRERRSKTFRFLAWEIREKCPEIWVFRGRPKIPVFSFGNVNSSRRIWRCHRFCLTCQVNNCVGWEYERRGRKLSFCYQEWVRKVSVFVPAEKENVLKLLAVSLFKPTEDTWCLILNVTTSRWIRNAINFVLTVKLIRIVADKDANGEVGSYRFLTQGRESKIFRFCRKRLRKKCPEIRVFWRWP